MEVEKVWLKQSDASQLSETFVDANQHKVYIDKDEKDISELKCKCPISGTVYGTILNYKGELDQLGEQLHKDPYKKPPEAPVLYIKPSNTFNGNNFDIPLPSGVEEVSVGAALGIVIGKQATKVKEEEAFDYIRGYTIANDVTIPHESVYRPAVKYKARDGFCPIGPWIMNKEEVDSPDHLVIQVWINDQLKQVNSTENLIRPVSKLLADVTDFMTLYEGDVLLVGVPENAPKAKAGDVVKVEIDDVGALVNTVVPEAEMKEGGKHS